MLCSDKPSRLSVRQILRLDQSCSATQVIISFETIRALSHLYSGVNVVCLDFQPSDRTDILSNGTLVLRNTTTADSATYTCVVSNDYGEDRLSVVLLVTGELLELHSLDEE